MSSIKESLKKSAAHNISEAEFKSTHDLDFEIGGFYITEDFIKFKIGTC